MALISSYPDLTPSHAAFSKALHFMGFNLGITCIRGISFKTGHFISFKK